MLQPEKHSPSEARRLPQLILKELHGFSQSKKCAAVKHMLTQILKSYIKLIYRKKIILEASELASQSVWEPYWPVSPGFSAVQITFRIPFSAELGNNSYCAIGCNVLGCEGQRNINHSWQNSWDLNN